MRQISGEMATSKVMNGHQNGELLTSINKKFNETTPVENKRENKSHTNGSDDMNGHSDHIDEEERQYLDEVERIRKLTR